MENNCEDDGTWQYVVSTLRVPEGKRFVDKDAARKFLEEMFILGEEHDTIAILADYLAGARPLRLRTAQGLIQHLIHTELRVWKAKIGRSSPYERRVGHIVSFGVEDLMARSTPETDVDLTEYRNRRAIPRFRPMSTTVALLWVVIVCALVVVAAVLLDRLQ